MGIISCLLGNYKVVANARIGFDEIRTHGEINVSPGYDANSSMHLIVLFQIAKMLYITPRNYSYTCDFIKTYFDACDESCISDKDRFKTALLNKRENKLRYFFTQTQNVIEKFESKLVLSPNNNFSFKTKIPIVGGRTDAALSTPLVLLGLIAETGNTTLIKKTQNSVRLMCGKYLNGYDWTKISNCKNLPCEIFNMNH